MNWTNKKVRRHHVVQVDDNKSFDETSLLNKLVRPGEQIRRTEDPRHGASDAGGYWLVCAPARVNVTVPLSKPSTGTRRPFSCSTVLSLS